METMVWPAFPLVFPALGAAFFLAFVFLFLLTKIPLLRKTRARREGERSQILPRSFRLGGVALILSFSLVLFFDTHLVITPEIRALLLGSGAILLFGLWDDWRPIPWFMQLLFQLALGFLLVFSGFRIEIMQGIFGGTWDLRNSFIPALPFLAVFLCLLLIMNSMNWVDGLDGLVGSIALIGCLALFFVSIFPEVRQPALSIIALTLVGSLVAFLVFNWPPARILAGTGGAYFLGFILASLSIFAGAKVATALLVLTVPVFDALFVLFERLHEGKSLFLPDRRHLHYRLQEIGWSERKIVFFYSVMTAGMAALALVTRTGGKIVILALAFFFLLTLFLFLRSLTRQRETSML